MAGLVRTRTRVIGKVKLPLHLSVDDEKILINRDRIVCYERVNGKAIAVINDDYVNSLKRKINELVQFLFRFEGFLAVYYDFSRLRQEFEKAFLEASDCMQSIAASIDSTINYYQTARAQGIHDRDLMIAIDNSPVTNRKVEEVDNNLLIDMFDKRKKLFDLQQLKEYERDKAKKMEDAQKRIIGSQENLDHLYAEKQIIEENLLIQIENDFNGVKYRLQEFTQYEVSITEKGNLLTLEENLNINELQVETERIIIEFARFHSIYLRVIRLKAEIDYHERFIELNNQRWEASIRIKGEEAAKPFLNNAHKYIFKQLQKAHQVYQDSEINDFVKHLQDSMVRLNKTVNNIKIDINSVRVAGDISIGYNGSVNNSIRIDRSISEKFRFIPENYIKSERTLIAQGVTIIIQVKLNLIIEEEKLLEIYQEDQRRIIELLIGNEQGKLYEEGKKHEELAKNSMKYEKLIQYVNGNDFSIRPELVSALMGMFLNSLSIKRNPGACPYEISDFLATEIAVPQLYEDFSKLLVKKGRCTTKCCQGSIDLVHTCKKMYFEDFADLFLSVRSAGCFKNEFGQNQTKNKDLRNEEIKDSLYSCIKGIMTILALGKQIELEMNKENTEKKIKYYEDSEINLLEKYNYRKIIGKIKKYKLYKH